MYVLTNAYWYRNHFAGVFPSIMEFKRPQVSALRSYTSGFKVLYSLLYAHFLCLIIVELTPMIFSLMHFWLPAFTIAMINEHDLVYNLLVSWLH